MLQSGLSRPYIGIEQQTENLKLEIKIEEKIEVVLVTIELFNGSPTVISI